jgi:hypothetical protein
VEAGDVAAAVLVAEARLRGPQAFAHALVALRRTLAARGLEERLADALTRFIPIALAEIVRRGPSWIEALPAIEAAVGDLSSCRLPVTLFSAGIRYRHSGDEAVLLELPLEQRAILRGALQLDATGSAPTSAMNEPAPSGGGASPVIPAVQPVSRSEVKPRRKARRGKTART